MRKLDRKRVEEALWRANGNVALAAHYLGVDYHRLYHFINRTDRASSKAIRETLAVIRERVLDLAEQKLIASALEGKSWAIKFFLERQGRHRGYGDEVVVKSDGTVSINLQWPLDDTTV